LSLGTGVLERGRELPPPPGQDWLAATTSDVNGDGSYDVIWLNTNPLRMRVWLMKGTVPIEEGPDIPGPVVGPRDGG
jgi:hypothetical protein